MAPTGQDAQGSTGASTTTSEARLVARLGLVALELDLCSTLGLLLAPVSRGRLEITDKIMDSAKSL
jgi:hypothetical protein